MKNNICIIPARGGSKRIPRKNIKEFLGKPIIEYSIQAALKSNLFDMVLVSTDDEEIANVSKNIGAEVPFLRSNENSNDFATTIDVLKEVVNKLGASNQIFESICCLYPTAPFVSSKKLIESFECFRTNNYDSLLPIMRFNYPIQRSLKLTPDGKTSYQYSEFHQTRSQDLEEYYHDSGQFYWLKPTVLTEPSIITLNTGSIILSELEGQDIDNEVDWKLAELKYELLQSIKNTNF